MKRTQSIFLILIGVAVLIFTIFYISKEDTKDLLAKQESCVKAYEKMSAEAPKSSLDNEGMMTVSNHALYSQTQKSCVETLYVSTLSFKDKKPEAKGYFSIKDIYTGEVYFVKLFTNDTESKDVEAWYKSKLNELKTFGSDEK